MRARRFIAFAALGSSMLLVALFAGLGSAGADDVTPPPGDAPRFVTRCTFSHQLSDDPIVNFGLPGASHSHDFFGNTTTNAFSKVKSMKRGSTTCVNPLDKSGYWVPSLTVDGVSVLPEYTNVYYQSGGQAVRDDQDHPRGLKVVAGDAMATDAAKHEDRVVELRRRRRRHRAVGDTADLSVADVDHPHQLPGLLERQDARLARPQEPSRVSRDGRRVPGRISRCRFRELRVNVHYPTTGGPGVALASGGQFSGHADFFNVWNSKELKRLVKTCINAGITCNAKA